jgi:hypothetical protein
MKSEGDTEKNCLQEGNKEGVVLLFQLNFELGLALACSEGGGGSMT